MKKRPTLSDVARHAQVSEATVSRVLNSPKIVSEGTRARVEASIKALQFRRSAAARAINSGRSRLVGALVPTLDNAIFSRFLCALEARLDRFGLSLIVSGTGGDPAVEVAQAHKMIDIGAEGLVVTGVTHDAAFHALVSGAGLPVVTVSQFDPDQALPTVGYDNAEAVRIAFDHLRALHHRRIAILHGPVQHNDRTSLRRAALVAHDDVSETDFLAADISIEGGRRLMASVLAARQYSAVLCFSDVLAMGALFELHAQGVSVPAEMSVIGIENLPSAAFTAPPLTTVRLQVAEMGTQAANALGCWVEDGVRPDHIYLKSGLIVRDSTAPCP